jgi:hypothetical protein
MSGLGFSPTPARGGDTTSGVVEATSLDAGKDFAGATKGKALLWAFPMRRMRLARYYLMNTQCDKYVVSCLRGMHASTRPDSGEGQHCLDHLMARRFMMFLACLGMPVMR